MNIRTPLFLTAALTLTACVQNPVTGERNLQFYDADWERQVGAQMYAPMRQSQGGDLVIDPELTAYVAEVGERLAAQSRRGNELDYEFRVLNNSTPNAWALPGGKIAINRGLLTELKSEAELAAVLGHEIIHADAAHSARQQSKGVLTQVGAMAGLILIDSTVDSTSGKQAAAMVPLLGAQLLSQRYSRDAEREADKFGMQYMSEAGYDPEGAVELQETFVRLSEGRPDDWLSGLFASHPPSQERVERNRETAAELPSGGEQGRERYAARLAYMNRIKPAYESYDKALKAASEENFDTARSELDRALAIEPRESMFQALDADLKMEAGKRRPALKAYDRAVRYYDQFFYTYLRRGHLYYEMGEAANARTDLERSLELLPTGAAHYLLGNLERDAGQREAAMEHYAQAAQTDSLAGRAAEWEMVRMDIDDDPAKYVAVGGAADARGKVYCVVGNRTRIDLQNIQVTARYRNDEGKVLEARGARREPLSGQTQYGIDMGWRTLDSTTIAQRLQCQVVSAKVGEAVEGG